MQVSNKLKALTEVAEYIVGFDSKEYDDYIDWCDSQSLNPSDITGEAQSSHIYALALVGLGLKFEDMG
jgi:hypothetical protein